MLCIQGVEQKVYPFPSLSVDFTRIYIHCKIDTATQMLRDSWPAFKVSFKIVRPYRTADHTCAGVYLTTRSWPGEFTFASSP